MDIKGLCGNRKRAKGINSPENASSGRRRRSNSFWGLLSGCNLLTDCSDLLRDRMDSLRTGMDSLRTGLDSLCTDLDSLRPRLDLLRALSFLLPILEESRIFLA
jgi:hypothetical protein